MNNRKKIAILLYIFLIFGSVWDIFFTHHFSPNLDYEVNPIVVYFGYKWSTVLLLKAGVLVMGAWYCIKLYTNTYTKPFFSEQVNNKLFKSPLKSPKQRYILDFTFVFGFALSFILAGSAWIIAHVDASGLFDKFLGIELLGFHLSMLVIILIVFPLGYFIGLKVANRFIFMD